MRTHDTEQDMLAPTNVEATHLREMRDQQYELSGETTGRVKRFLPESNSLQAIEAKREDDARRLFQLQQQVLLQDQEFDALYNDTLDLANRASMLTANAITEIETRLAQQEDALTQDLKTDANRLPDGSYVFLDEHGNAVRADGTALTEEERDSVVWREGAMTYAQYRRRQQEIEETRQKLDEYREYERKVGEAQHRLETEKDTLTKDDVKEIQDDLKRSAPTELQTELDPSSQAKLADYSATTDTILTAKPPI